MKFCKKCRAEIHWIVTSAGKKMPIDSWPPPDKKRIKVKTTSGEMEVVPHFATCPYANDFKGKRG